MADHIARGLPPGHEVASLVGNAALIYNQPFERVAMLHILDRAASTGQLPMFLGGGGQAGLLEQVLSTGLRSSNPDRRAEAVESLESLAALASHVRDLILIQELRRVVSSIPTASPGAQ